MRSYEIELQRFTLNLIWNLFHHPMQEWFTLWVSKKSFKNSANCSSSIFNFQFLTYNCRIQDHTSAMNSDRKLLSQARLLVIKLGASVLSVQGGGLNSMRVGHITAQIAGLHRFGKRFVVVSSGAIAAGMARLGLHRRPSHIADLQACAAIGQNLLMANYERAFARRKLTVAQILLTHEDFRHEERRRNARQTILNLLRRGVVPIINENDAVSFAEIKFGDNDQLAAMIHELIHAHACILLSNIDGFMIRRSLSIDRLPRHGQAKAGGPWTVVSTISRITANIERHAGDSDSHQSVGGMRSKLIAARCILATRSPLVIANGHLPNILPRLLRGEVLGTIFLPVKIRV